MIAKKSLGQNFLVNKNKIKEIVESLQLESNLPSACADMAQAGDIVIEIGPGHGELTQEILKNLKNGKIISIEKDEELSVELPDKFKGNGNIEIIKGDALKILPDLTKKLKAKSYKLVGNIPYYITGHLFRIFGELKNKPKLIVLTVQKEVAERVCAKPPKMNLLAASVQFWANMEIIGHISKKDFNPVPRVDSAIIALRPLIENDKMRADSGNYYRFIKILFKQPRKTILNNLKPITDNQKFIKEKLESIKINSLDRTQNLSIKQIIQLSEIFSAIL